MSLKNLPVGEHARLSSLITCRPGQVSSKSLGRGDASIMLMGFSEGESVSEEIYPGDVLYQALAGSVVVALPDGQVELSEGNVTMVPAGVPHSISGKGDFKLMQIIVEDPREETD
ncbi:MAG: hypothetical protein ACOYIK_04735 [Coriobacteriales bacterium]|jgi:quercetin dioxygenase-like cupin family protein